MMNRQCIVVIVSLLCLSTEAWAQHKAPILFKVKNLYSGSYGSSIPLEERIYNSLSIKAMNRLGHPVKGVITIGNKTGSFRREARLRQELPIEIPAGATRQAQITTYVPFDPYELIIDFESSDIPSSRKAFNVTRSSDRRLVFLTEKRAPILTKTREEFSGLGSPFVMDSIELDPLSGDPVMPRYAAGWATVKLFVTTVPLFERADGQEREALITWIRQGGSVVFLARNEDELRRPWIREVADNLEWVSFGESDMAHVRIGGPKCLSPPSIEPCQVRHGLGLITFMALENTPFMLKRTVHDIEVASRRYGKKGLTTAYQGVENVSYGRVTRLLPTLDPNRGYQPQIPYVAIILVVYLLLVGPVNFYVIRKKNRPTLALVTVPLLSIFAVFLVILIGTIGRGVGRNARQIELIQTVSDQSYGSTTTLSGLFHGVPATYDLEWSLPGAVRLLSSKSGEKIRAFDHGTSPPAYRDIRGSFWGTVFTEEHNMADLGGSISLSTDDGEHTIVNNLKIPLDGAILVTEISGGSHWKYQDLGRITPGGRVKIQSTDPVETLRESQIWSLARGDRHVQQSKFIRCFKLNSEIEKRAFGGMLDYYSDDFDRHGRRDTPFLFAQVKSQEDGDIAGVFDRAMDLRFLLVFKENKITAVGPSSLLGNTKELPTSTDILKQIQPILKKNPDGEAARPLQFGKVLPADNVLNAGKSAQSPDQATKTSQKATKTSQKATKAQKNRPEVSQ